MTPPVLPRDYRLVCGRGQMMRDDVLEGTAGGYRVVPCKRRVRGIREGEQVVLLPVEAILADAQLLALPTVRRVAREGFRGVVLMPLAEWREWSAT